MREINEHLKEVMKIKPQPKPSSNPKNWNWTAILTWISLGAIVCIIISTLIKSI